MKRKPEACPGKRIHGGFFQYLVIFGCAGSSLWPMGSSLQCVRLSLVVVHRHMGPVVAAQGLSSCGAGA